ncbi:MAG: acylphosphatase [Pseudodesulfovibrio sp.]|nr:acylphosphatase [Pseudodesulfovibrio sp.]
MKELHAIVFGKVQGVWFRAWTIDLAREQSVAGWVRNTPEGNVEIVGQADTEHLNNFLERLHHGPPLARVTRIESSWKKATTQFSHFELRR